MKTVLFLMYHGRGHFNAVFKLARIVSETHQVIFAGYEYFRSDVITQGFRFYGLQTVPFGLGFEPWVNQMEKKKHIYWNCLKDRWTQRLYHQRKTELLKLVANVDPQTILIDAWQSTDFVALYAELNRRRIRTAFVQTMLPTLLQANQSPLTASTLPHERQAIMQSRADFFRSRLLKEIKQRIVYLGKSNKQLIDESIRLNKLPDRYYPEPPSLFSPFFPNVKQLVLAPLEFDFMPASRPEIAYTGFMADIERLEIADNQFEDLYASICRKIDSGIALIYCSFGSVHYESVQPIKEFLENLSQAMTALNACCIVSCGDSTILRSFPQTADNLYFFKTVPQLRVLAKASVFISHGGLNSIKEAIYYNVPMLLYPVSNDVDHQGNSARVVYHHLGLRGDLKKDSPAEVTRKINELLSSPAYRENLRLFKQTDSEYSRDNFWKIFSDITPLD